MGTHACAQAPRFRLPRKHRARSRFKQKCKNDRTKDAGRAPRSAEPLSLVDLSDSNAHRESEDEERSGDTCFLDYTQLLAYVRSYVAATQPGAGARTVLLALQRAGPGAHDSGRNTVYSVICVVRPMSNVR